MGPRGTYLQTGSNNRHSKVFQRGAVIQFVSSNVGGQFYYKVYSYCITASLGPVPFLIFITTLTLVLWSLSRVVVKIYPNYTRFALKKCDVISSLVFGIAGLWGGNAIIHATANLKMGYRMLSFCVACYTKTNRLPVCPQQPPV